MKKIKSQKGITLIALIITIIVLLILAVVAIGAVQNDGIINHAKNARQEYGAAQVNENTTLGNYIEKLNEHNPVKKIITFTIDGTTYSAEEGMTWEQWANSKYYDTTFKMNSDRTIVTYKNGIIDKSMRNANNTRVIYSNEIIEDGAIFSMKPVGEGVDAEV